MKVGIDTSLNIFSKVGGSNLSLIADTKAWLGQNPDFVIRPMGNGGGPATPVTKQEIADTLAMGIAMGLYYNDSPLNGGQTGNYAIGQQDALNAISQADALGAPSSLYLTCDIEESTPGRTPVQVNAEWIHGWCDTMRASRFAGSGCIYGIVGSGLLNQALMQALGDDTNGNVHRLFLWPADWIYRAGLNYVNAAGIAWTPPVVNPKYASMTQMWQLSGNDFNDIADESICTEAMFQSFWKPSASSVSAPASTNTNSDKVKALLQQAISLL